jgi:PHD/YefM family antitoxin component YafN of YafNO toxin-antitoxin module
MNIFDKIKEILRTGSGKCVVLENGEPKYVVMTWSEYHKIEEEVEELKALAGKQPNWETIDINSLPL